MRITKTENNEDWKVVRGMLGFLFYGLIDNLKRIWYTVYGKNCKKWENFTNISLRFVVNFTKSGYSITCGFQNKVSEKR